MVFWLENFPHTILWPNNVKSSRFSFLHPHHPVSLSLSLSSTFSFIFCLRVECLLLFSLKGILYLTPVNSSWTFVLLSNRCRKPHFIYNCVRKIRNSPCVPIQFYHMLVSIICLFDSMQFHVNFIFQSKIIAFVNNNVPAMTTKHSEINVGI